MQTIGITLRGKRKRLSSSGDQIIIIIEFYRQLCTRFVKIPKFQTLFQFPPMFQYRSHNISCSQGCVVGERLWASSPVSLQAKVGQNFQPSLRIEEKKRWSIDNFWRICWQQRMNRSSKRWSATKKSKEEEPISSQPLTHAKRDSKGTNPGKDWGEGGKEDEFTWYEIMVKMRYISVEDLSSGLSLCGSSPAYVMMMIWIKQEPKVLVRLSGSL